MSDSSKNEYKLNEEQIEKQEYFQNLYDSFSHATQFTNDDKNVKEKIDELWDLFITLVKDETNKKNIENAFKLYVGEKIDQEIIDNIKNNRLKEELDKAAPDPLPKIFAKKSNHYYLSIGDQYVSHPDWYGVAKGKDGKYLIGNEKFDREKALKVFKGTIVNLVNEITSCKDADAVCNNTVITNAVNNTENLPKGTPKKGLVRFMVIMQSMRRADDCDYFNCFPTTVDDGAVERLASACKVNIEGKSFFEDGENINKAEMKILDLDTEKLKDDEEFHRFKAFSWDKLAKDEWYKNLKIKPGSFTNMNIILHGAPGTGKTFSVAREIDHCRIIDNDKYGKLEPVFIQFHPSYTYQDFIEGIKPAGIVGGSLDLKPMNGSFKQFCIDVKKKNEEHFNKLVKDELEEPNSDEIEVRKKLKMKYNKDNPKNFEDWPHYFFVVDEINRGNLSSIFGETFTLLEYRDYDFSGVYDKKGPELVETVLSNLIKSGNDSDKAGNDSDKAGNDSNKAGNNSDLIYKEIGGKVLFGIPFNIHFIGMMNDVDRSIDSFDLALRRRFCWEELRCDYDVIENSLKAESFFKNDFRKSCERLNKYITETKKLGKKYEIGHAFFLKIKDIAETDNKGNLRISVKNKESLFDERIAGTLREYFSYNSNNGESDVDNSVKEARKIFAKEETDIEKIEKELVNSKLYNEDFIKDYITSIKALNTYINGKADQLIEIEADYFLNPLVKNVITNGKDKQTISPLNFKKTIKCDEETMKAIFEFVCDDAGNKGSIEKRINQWLKLWNKDDKIIVKCIDDAKEAFLKKLKNPDKNPDTIEQD